ncbi:hypothetical protein IWQ62_001872 [Dispira parvispora]|uniref:Uncharacterized protein n=1 Tax=Dispira parvispora TaxID=1520584 RepID=A0A9W8E3C3_9FUNG|nr:hypothetical protein IWQ62_001872 [Dispira parvispora]
MYKQWFAQVPLEALVETDTELLDERNNHDFHQKWYPHLENLLIATDLLNKFQQFTHELQPKGTSLSTTFEVWREMMYQYQHLSSRRWGNTQEKRQALNNFHTLRGMYQNLLDVVIKMDQEQHDKLRMYVEHQDSALKHDGNYLDQLKEEWVATKSRLDNLRPLALGINVEWVSYTHITNVQHFLMFPLLYTLHGMSWSKISPFFHYTVQALAQRRHPIAGSRIKNGISLLLRQIIPMLLITRLFDNGFKRALDILGALVTLDEFIASDERPEYSVTSTWIPAYERFINHLAHQFKTRGSFIQVRELSPQSQEVFEYLTKLEGTVYKVVRNWPEKDLTLYLAIDIGSYRRKTMWGIFLREYLDCESKRERLIPCHHIASDQCTGTPILIP